MFDENGKAKFYNITNGVEIIGKLISPIFDLLLNNTTLSGTYEAQNSIITLNNVTVSGQTELMAGNSINLKPGFTAPSGTNFTAKIGTITNKGDRYYYLKDHLGSIRVVVDTVGEIVSYDDYDAWGMILNGRSSNFGYADDKYKFTGKELDTETGYFHFGARAYDGRIGRWNVIDPLFEKYPNVSPYNYALNNPLRFIDPNGMEVGDYYDKDWNYLGSDGKDDNKVYNSTEETITNATDQDGNINWDNVSENSTYLGLTTEVFVTWDNITNNRILDLDPAVRGKATQFINTVEIEQGIQLRISQGFRSVEEQNVLYSQGRTTPGKIVTNVKGGSSYHNYGLAIDVVKMQNGNALVHKKISSEVAGIGIALGFEWGGNWSKFKDFPHFQMTFGKTISQLKGK